MAKGQHKVDAAVGASGYERRDPVYAHMSLLELLMAIAWLGDRDAHLELIQHRTIFQFGSQHSLLLLDFISRLVDDRRERARNKETILWDRALDSVVMKFTSMLAFNDVESSEVNVHEEIGEQDEEDERVSKWRVNCRLYFMALLTEILHEKTAIEAENAIARELGVAHCFQRFVIRHLYLSYLEACRQANPFVSRYTWHVDGCGSVTVWLPKYMRGRERKLWLEQNVNNANPKRAGERDRIQSIINEKLAIPSFHRMDNYAHTAVRAQTPGADEQMERDMRPNMVNCVAKKTAESLDRQRKAIRKLGGQDLEALVKALLQDSLPGGRTLESIAADFGVSKATLSRFFGPDWSKGNKGADTKVPDLVRIVAAIVSSDEIFMEVAAQAGVLAAAREIVNDGESPRLKEHNDE